MSNWSARLAELGITLPPVAKPAGAYVPALRVGDLVYTSGQLPFVDGKLPRTGIVGVGPEFVDPEQAKALAQFCALNALAAVHDLVGIDNVAQVVKVTGFVASAPDFGGQPGVINGASELLGQVFGEAGSHARAAVGVAALPLNAPVEVEITLLVKGSAVKGD